MAHELDINNGVASFAARTDAWHRLGQIVGHAMDAETALAAAHLAGWNVRKMALVVPQEAVIADNGVTTRPRCPLTITSQRCAPTPSRETSTRSGSWAASTSP
jgi:hypothetical protein